MKNRTYLMLVFILFIVINLVYAIIYKHKDLFLSMYWDAISLFMIVIPLISIYVVVFPDMNQVSSLYINKYKIRWLSELSIFLGTYATILGILATLIGISASGGIYSENLSFPLGNSLAVAFITMIYALVLSFSFYVISFFLIDSKQKIKEIGNRYIAKIIAWLFIIVIYGYTFMLLLSAISISEMKIINILGLDDKKIYLFFGLIFLFLNFQKNSSILKLFKNLLVDSKQSISEIKSQIKAIKNTKRFVGGLMMISVIFFSTSFFISLNYFIDQPNEIFSMFVSGTQLIHWCFFIIILLIILEGKYNYQLYNNEEIINHDRTFIVKYVALPTILYFIMLALIFVLSNVLL